MKAVSFEFVGKKSGYIHSRDDFDNNNNKVCFINNNYIMFFYITLLVQLVQKTFYNWGF